MWCERAFDELTVPELYAILELRARVFVVEQACVYLDPDGKDRVAHHLWNVDAAGALTAYARVLPAGVAFAEVSIGRVITAPPARGSGVGRALMTRGIALAHARFGAPPIRIAAQAHLEAFYGSLGFARAGEPYVEDGIAHVDMLLT